jgi:hypothetical protein
MRTAATAATMSATRTGHGGRGERHQGGSSQSQIFGHRRSPE